MSFTYQRRFPSKNRTNYYAILGINKTADQTTISKAYRQQALYLHPDKNPGHEKYNGFLELVDAYNTLSDPEKKSVYDASYNFNDSVRRDFDPDITPEEATPILQEFFDLFFKKRGCSIEFNAIKIIQRESTVPPEEYVRFFKSLDRVMGIEREEFPYASWHYLQLSIINNQSTRETLNEAFAELQNIFSNDSQFRDAFTVEIRQMKGNNEAGIMDLDIHLHNVHLLKLVIDQLKAEDPSILLTTLIERKLKENPKNTCALAAKKIIDDLGVLEKSNKISPTVAARILYVTRVTLHSPTANNLEACHDFIKKNEHGKRNWWKIIGGSFIAFIGLATFFVGFSCFPLGICLSAVGLALCAGGSVLAYEGRQTGLARSLGSFFNASTKNLQTEVTHNPPLDDAQQLTNHNESNALPSHGNHSLSM